MTSVLSHSLHLECQRLLSDTNWRKLLICTDSCILLRFHVIVFSLKTIFHSFFLEIFDLNMIPQCCSV